MADDKLAKWLYHYAGSIARDDYDDNPDNWEEDAKGEVRQQFLSDAAELRALLASEAEPVGYITPRDLARIQSLEPWVPSVNVWAEPDDNDIALYLAPPAREQVERDHAAMEKLRVMGGVWRMIGNNLIRDSFVDRLGFVTDPADAILGTEDGDE